MDGIKKKGLQCRHVAGQNRLVLSLSFDLSLDWVTG